MFYWFKKDKETNNVVPFRGPQTPYVVPPVPEKGVRLDKDIVLEPPFNVPAVLVHAPEKVCDNPAPKFKVPPVPLIVKPAPFIFPVKVAVPAGVDGIETPLK